MFIFFRLPPPSTISYLCEQIAQERKRSLLYQPAKSTTNLDTDSYFRWTISKALGRVDVPLNTVFITIQIIFNECCS